VTTNPNPNPSRSRSPNPMQWAWPEGAWPGGHVTALDQSNFRIQNPPNYTTIRGLFGKACSPTMGKA